MDYTCRTRALSSLAKDIKNNKYNFNHKLQRKELQWNNLQRSELIDSTLRSYPIDPIRGIVNGDKLDVIDGVQRATSIRDFLSDGFKLNKKLKPVTIDNEEFIIAGKKYSDLDEKVRDVINEYEIQVYRFSDCTDEDIREMFRRQNSGKSLNPSQKRTALESDNVGNIIFTLLSHPFMDKVTTKAQIKSAADKDFIRQVLMLMSGYDITSLRSSDIDNFILWYNDNINADDVDIIIKAMDKLDDVFTEDISVKKLVTPLMIYGMAECIRREKNVDEYISWLKDFLETYDSQTEFLKYCDGGTASAEKVYGRIQFFKDAIDGFSNNDVEEDEPVVEEGIDDVNEESEIVIPKLIRTGKVKENTKSEKYTI